MLPSIISVYFEFSVYSTDGGILFSSRFRGRTKHVLADKVKQSDADVPCNDY